MPPRRHSWSFWQERGRTAAEHLADLSDALREAGAVVRAGGDFDRWDLEVRLGSLGASRILLAPEEHGGGRQLLRFRIYPWVSPAWLTLAALSLAAGVGAAAGGAWLVAAPLGLVALLVAARAWFDSGQAIGVVRGALDDAPGRDARAARSARIVAGSGDERAALSVTAQFRLLRYLWPHWKDLCVVVITMAVTVGLEVLRPWPTKILVDQVLGQQPVPDFLSWLLLWLPGSGGVRGLLFWVCACTVLIFFAGTLMTMATMSASVRLGQRMVFDLGADLFAHLQRLSLLFHSRRAVGDTIARVTGDAYGLQILVNSALLPLFQSRHHPGRHVRGDVAPRAHDDAAGAWASCPSSPSPSRCSGSRCRPAAARGGTSRAR